MKTQLLLLLFLLPSIMITSCSKSSDAAPTESKSGFILYVKKNSKLSTGELVASNLKAGVIHVWKADGKNFSITSSTDAINGYAYDNITKTSIKSNYTYVNTFTESQDADPGQYFVFVILDSSLSSGKLAYSYTTFTVKKGEFNTTTKIFASSTTSLSFQEWSKQD